MTNSVLRIGTRGSPLALAQAHEVQGRLARATSRPVTDFEIVVISTQGDRVLDRPLAEIGGKGLFTREIEEALLAGSIDLAVHSLKDMPTEQPAGLALDAFLPREDPRDALVSPRFTALVDLPDGCVVGTSSLRRRAQLLALRPDLKTVALRGNVGTRLKKLGEGVAEATFLAMAGLNRLGLADVPKTAIDPTEMLPAVCQGIVAIERRLADAQTAELLQRINDPASTQMAWCERAFLARLDGSCQTPIAGLSHLDGDTITLRGEILKPDGSQRFGDSITGDVDKAERLGRELAETLLNRAGPDFLAS